MYLFGLSLTLPPFVRRENVPSCVLSICGQIHAVIATVETGFLTGIPTTMVEDISPSLKTLDNAVMDNPNVRFTKLCIY